MFLFVLIPRRCLHFYNITYCLCNSSCLSPEVVRSLLTSPTVLCPVWCWCGAKVCAVVFVSLREEKTSGYRWLSIRSCLCYSSLLVKRDYSSWAGSPWQSGLGTFGLRTHMAELNPNGTSYYLCDNSARSKCWQSLLIAPVFKYGGLLFDHLNALALTSFFKSPLKLGLEPCNLSRMICWAHSFQAQL